VGFLPVVEEDDEDEDEEEVVEKAGKVVVEVADEVPIQ
jgi:hypothetical protein